MTKIPGDKGFASVEVLSYLDELTGRLSAEVKNVLLLGDNVTAISGLIRGLRLDQDPDVKEKIDSSLAVSGELAELTNMLAGELLELTGVSIDDGSRPAEYDKSEGAAGSTEPKIDLAKRLIRPEWLPEAVNDNLLPIDLFGCKSLEEAYLALGDRVRGASRAYDSEGAIYRVKVSDRGMRLTLSGPDGKTISRANLSEPVVRGVNMFIAMRNAGLEEAQKSDFAGLIIAGDASMAGIVEKTNRFMKDGFGIENLFGTNGKARKMCRYIPRTGVTFCLEG